MKFYLDSVFIWLAKDEKKIHSIIDLDSLTTHLVSSIPKLNFIYVAFEM